MPSLATDTSTDLLFVGDATGRLAQVDPATGTIINSIWLWNAASSNAVAMTPDPVNQGRIWSLHADGWAVNWSDGPSMESFFAIPILGAGQVQCDIDVASDGDLYLTFVQGGTAWLGRRDGASLSWNWSTVPGQGCPRIAHDLYFDELYVLRGNGFQLEHRDANTLVTQSTVPLDADGGAFADVDVFASTGVGAGTSGGGQGPGGQPLPTYRMAWHFDPDTGTQMDAKISGTLPPSAVQLSLKQDVSKAELLIGYINGVAGFNTPTLRGNLLL